MSQRPASIPLLAPTPSPTIKVRDSTAPGWFRRSIQALPPQIWLIVSLAVTIRVALAIATRYTSEDYMITLRYAENLAHGNGMVYNVGERVLGTTTPLYTLFLAMAAWVHLSPTICGKTVNILADGVLCALLYLWLRHERLEKEARLAAFLAAVHPVHLQWSISGMETSFVTATGVWALYAFCRRKYVETYFAMAVLFLLRWDSLLMAAVITTAIWWKERRAPAREMFMFAILIAPWLVAAGHFYGNPIPVTGQAKMQVYGWFADHLPVSNLRHETTGSALGISAIVRLEPTWLLRRLPRQQGLLNFFFGSPIPALMTLAGGIGAYRLAHLRRWMLAPAVVWVALYLGAFLVSRVLLFNWYMVPPFPVYEILVAAGLIACGDRAGQILPAAIRRIVLVIGIVTAAAAPALAMSVILDQSQRIEEDERRPIGEWLDGHCAPGDRILLEPIGYIGYYSHRPIIDVIGLVSPQVLRFYTPSARSPWLAQIMAYRPEWCVLRPAEFENLRQESVSAGIDWNSDYSMVRTYTYTPRKNETPLIFHVFRRVRREQSKPPLAPSRHGIMKRSSDELRTSS